MVSRLFFLIAGIAIGTFRPNAARDALKGLIRAGMTLSELAKRQAERAREDVTDLVTEIEHENVTKGQLTAPIEKKDHKKSSK
jgi:hypothetical protein